MARTRKWSGEAGTVAEAQISAWVKRLNRKIGTWAEFDSITYDVKVRAVKRMLTFTDPATGEKTEPTWDGDKLVLDKSTRAHLTRFIEATREKQDKIWKKEEKEGLPRSEMKQNTLEAIDSMQTAREEMRKVEKDMKDGKGISAAKLTTVKEEQERKPGVQISKEQVKEYNRNAVLTEIAGRYQKPNVKLKTVLNKAYEDEVANADLLDRLRKGRWTPDLLADLNAATDAWNLVEEESEDF